MKFVIAFSIVFAYSGNAKAQKLPDVSGSWLQRQVTTSNAKVPVVGKVSSESEAFILVQIAQDGAKLKIKTETCRVELESEFKKVRAFIPMRFLKLMKHSRIGYLAIKNGEVRFEQTLAVDLFGAKLKNKRTDALPEKKKDPNVVDQDGDKHPGVTVRTRGLIKGKIFVVQRNKTRLHGVVVGDEISGTVDWRTEQNVIGASNPFLNKNPNAVPDPDPSKSHFRMIRAKNAKSCDDALKFRKQFQP